MKINSSSKSLKTTLLIFIFNFIFAFGVQAQDNTTEEEESNQETIQVISIDNVSSETEKIVQRIYDLNVILEPSAKVYEVDSLLLSAVADMEVKRDSLFSEFEDITRRKLRVRKVEWEKYRSLLKEYQAVLNGRTEEVSLINDELIEEIKKWQQTKEILISNSESSDVYDSFDDVINSLEDVIKIAVTRIDSIFVIQKKLTGLVLICDELISEIERVELQMKKDYFVFDSNPIWKTTKDSINPDEKSISAIGQIKNGVKENKQQLKEFLKLNVKSVVFQVTFILLLLVLMLVVRKRWKIDKSNLTNPLEIQAKTVLAYPIASSAVVGVLVSVFFYDALIPAFAELNILTILIGTVFLLPKLTNKLFTRFLLLAFFIYLIHLIEAYIDPKSSMARWLVLFQSVLLLVGLILGKRIMAVSPDQFPRIYKIFKILVPAYTSILGIALLVNIIGMVNLARFLTFGILVSTILGVVVYLGVKIIASIVILIFKLRSYSLHAVSTMVQATHKRIQPILFFAGLLLWIVFTLKGFGLYNSLITWISDSLHVEWLVGEMTISLGGILSFLGIFTIALLTSKLVASIFQDDWMLKVLPKGVAPATSLLLRIALVSIGLYTGLSAAGLDLSKLGFIIGALGVGIGFGLQSIVLNFIAGLILAFERPINLGDTIEIDNEFGVVTSIGIRSSNVRNYSGSEAIIPNGDLISKKVINWTLSNRERRSNILLKTSPNADPQTAIDLFNKIASEHPNTFDDPAPKTFFKGYQEDGNLLFQLWYWTTFSETLDVNHDIAMRIHTELKEAGIDAPVAIRRIIKG